ncbi:MAG: radical SAM protein [Candidatus Pacearchaeota archaeon]|jgi:MoaA/NifB/PqqE/SkfB family radical SAM enzyme
MKIIPEIPVVYNKKFPNNFVNKVDGWGFSKEELEENKGKILNLDIDFGNVCSLNCPHCFRRENKVDFGKGKALTYDEIVSFIKEAKKLGLKSVKFLGAGEPFEDKLFIKFLRFLKEIDVIPVIFTKGHIIGDDDLAKFWNSDYGINNSKQLIEELKKVNASILLGFNSFDTEKQDKMVGGVKGYTLKRNRALEMLVKAGFNRYNPTKLCLAANPITHENYDEILEIYKWAIVRNIYVIVCPTMVSGRCAETAAWQNITPSKDKLIDLYVKIYRFNIEKGIQTLKQIKDERISAYAGGYPCNQVACGVYITLGGIVLRCPGDDITIFGDIRKRSLKEIWENCETYKRAGIFNCGCPPKMGKSIPNDFFKEVMSKLISKY